MILQFPDYDTIRLVLTSGIVPVDVTLAPAVVSFDAEGKVYVEPTVNISKAALRNLARISVKGSKRHATEDPQEVSCWPQLLPVVRESEVQAVSSQAPVLFEVETAEDLIAIITELLRLGNDRQSFRWFASPDRQRQQVLLRVIGPPYYTLLRALDRQTAGASGTVRAYIERAPRVWVEIGYSLPLAQQLRAPDQQLLLIRAPREWTYLEDLPFHDVYDILQFKLPAAAVDWAESKSIEQFTIPLKLTASSATDIPELWVLRENAVEQLDSLVRDSDQKLLQRLMFAVAANPNGGTIVVLRARPSKLTPPALALDNAVAFKPYWKITNLFLPAGKRLHPTLRRDKVRNLLAEDEKEIVWLYPDRESGFTPESVPESAFRLLEDWVEYVIESEHNTIATWITSTTFDYEQFVCKDTGAAKSKGDGGDKEQGRTDQDERLAREAAPSGKGSSKAKHASAVPKPDAEFLPPAVEVRAPSRWQLRAKELEARFLDVEGPLDSPERVELWLELAEAYAGAGKNADASLCWLNSLWSGAHLRADVLASWARSELPAVGNTIRAEEFDKLLNHSGIGLEESRRVVAAFLWLASLKQVPAWLINRLPAIQKYLETHQVALPVRAVWLAGYRLAQLAGADVLGLARVRDRLLERLLEQGLQAERDLPMFLRVSGLKDSQRVRMVSEEITKLYRAVRQWIDDAAVQQKQDSLKANHPLVALLFAFALARLGEALQAKALLEEARKEMEVAIPPVANQQGDSLVTAAIVKNFLFKAFKYRIEQVLTGNPHTGPLSTAVHEELAAIAVKGSGGPVNNPYKLAKYVIDRMREQSQIIEPQEKPDPYSDPTLHKDVIRKELAELHSVRDPKQLAKRINTLLTQNVAGKTSTEVQFFVLHESLTLAPRVNENFTISLLEKVPAVLRDSTQVIDSPDLPKKQGELLQRALYIAGHYNRDDVVRKLVDEVTKLIRSRPAEIRFKLINIVTRQCLRNLKKLGLRDEIDRFLTSLTREVLRGESLADLRKTYAGKPDAWSSVLQTLLNLAGGWLHLGLPERANPIIQEARAELLTTRSKDMQPKDYTPLARAYVSALGQMPSESGLFAMIELFKTMDPKKINNTWTTAQFYSRFHLNLVEDVILVLVSDESEHVASVRKWLDDDEYLVRRRIHADMKRILDKNHL